MGHIQGDEAEGFDGMRQWAGVGVAPILGSEDNCD